MILQYKTKRQQSISVLYNNSEHHQQNLIEGLVFLDSQSHPNISKRASAKRASLLKQRYI